MWCLSTRLGLSGDAIDGDGVYLSSFEGCTSCFGGGCWNWLKFVSRFEFRCGKSTGFGAEYDDECNFVSIGPDCDANVWFKWRFHNHAIVCRGLFVIRVSHFSIGLVTVPHQVLVASWGKRG